MRLSKQDRSVPYAHVTEASFKDQQVTDLIHFHAVVSNLVDDAPWLYARSFSLQITIQCPCHTTIKSDREFNQLYEFVSCIDIDYTRYLLCWPIHKKTFIAANNGIKRYEHSLGLQRLRHICEQTLLIHTVNLHIFVLVLYRETSLAIFSLASSSLETCVSVSTSLPLILLLPDFLVSEKLTIFTFNLQSSQTHRAYEDPTWRSDKFFQTLTNELIPLKTQPP